MFAFEKDFKMQQLFVQFWNGITVCKAVTDIQSFGVTKRNINANAWLVFEIDSLSN